MTLPSAVILIVLVGTLLSTSRYAVAAGVRRALLGTCLGSSVNKLAVGFTRDVPSLRK